MPVLQWASCSFLFCAGVALLAAGFFSDHALSCINIALYLLWPELLFTGIRWGLWEDNWPSLVAGGWLLACSLGVWTLPGLIYFPGPSIAATIHFLWVLLVGYLALRAGMLLGDKAQSLSAIAEKCCRILSPEYVAPRTFKRSLIAMGIGSCIGICCIYAYFGSIPLFSDNPPLARYQFFNGPFTKNLFRFFFRIFSAVSLISSMYLIVVLTYFSFKEKCAAAVTVLFTLLCTIASGSRGDFSVLLLFICINSIFLWPAKKRFFPGLMMLSAFAAAFCALTYYRIRDGLRSLSSVFPEIVDAALLVESARAHDVPFAWGKTYLAALLSFVPSSVFPFRETYGFGRYSLGILFLNSSIPVLPSYGGLRPTFVGEALLNGGIGGVVLFGVALGMILGTWRCRQWSIQRFSGAWVMFFLLSLLSVMVSDFYGVFHGVALVACSSWAVEKAVRGLHA